MKDKDYKRAWIEFKEELIRVHTHLNHIVKTSDSERGTGELYRVEQDLYRMDELDGTNDFKNLLSVVNELDLHNLHLRKTGLYEIAKVHGGKLISEPIRNLTVDEILDIVNKENEYGSVETRKLSEDE